ncbi:MAG: phosphatidate cytidylyltransferase [Myxococcales bacterium]
MSEENGGEPSNTTDTQPASAASEPAPPQPATPLPESKKSKSSELVLRLVSSAILIPTVLYVIHIGGRIYLGVVIAFILIALREFYGLIEDKGAQPLVGLGLCFGLAVSLIAYFGTEYHTTLLMTASLLVFMIAQLGKKDLTESLASISGTYFGVFYVAWLLSHAIVLRFFYDSLITRYDEFDVEWLKIVPETGAFFMTYTLAVLVACDAGAYFAGRAYGKRKLAPRISPNKSVEGAIGGLLLSIFVGAAIKGLYDYALPSYSAAFPWALAIGFAPVLAVVGIVGDLVESLLKRDAKVKDTGDLLPGMGGVLDRIDSPLLGIPMMYYMLLAWVEFKIG